MAYLNPPVLDGIEPAKFQAQEPYPWVNPQGFVRAEQYRELLDTMPDISQFRAFFGKQRKHGQSSHDRYTLDYERGMEIAPQWRDFVEELCGDGYRDCGVVEGGVFEQVAVVVSKGIVQSGWFGTAVEPEVAGAELAASHQFKSINDENNAYGKSEYDEYCGGVYQRGCVSC